jgi:predicted RNA-binding Zn ribbon-like protein
MPVSAMPQLPNKLCWCLSGGEERLLTTGTPTGTGPPHAALLRDFANTLDVDEGTDALTTPGDLSGWLGQRGLLDAGLSAGDDDLAVARLLREVLRDAFRANHGEAAAGTDTAMQQVTAALPLALGLRAGRPTVVPAGSGVRAALAHLLTAAVDCGADGSWSRLKICAADDCAWAFYDTSKNRSRTWCSMQVCGNRAKTRSYRARRGSAS